VGFLSNESQFSPLWSVSELTDYIKELFDIDFRLRDLEVSGEVSNYTRARSGHLYFTLKDETSQLKCVMWRTSAERLRFPLQDGDAVVVHGRVSVYEASGAYQLYADRIDPAGRGDLALAFERLKELLAAEGLFDAAHKKPLPDFPRKIGIVTSADAAALRDILNVLRRRFPLAAVLIAPTLVQGDQAPAQIVRALGWIDGRDDIDVIILARGGGSMEDLWAFNDERVARAVFAARHPIISGVGHETDFTITDFVADLRAPTPSVAAELVSPDLSGLPLYLSGRRTRLTAQLASLIEQNRRRLHSAAQALHLLSPRGRLDSAHQRIDGLDMRLEGAVERRLERWRTRVAVQEAELKTVSPLATLARGYAIVRDERGSLIRSQGQVDVGEKIWLQLQDGSFGALVNQVGEQTE
jgi:exodeoxyribonuclease VII large subunit